LLGLRFGRRRGGDEFDFHRAVSGSDAEFGFLIGKE
jgi:hypothetical protein